MNQAPLVRSASAADLATVTSIYAHHVRHGLASFEIEPPDAAEIARRHAAVVALGLPFLVAESGGAVGFKFGRWVDSVIMQRALGDGDSSFSQ